MPDPASNAALARIQKDIATILDKLSADEQDDMGEGDMHEGGAPEGTGMGMEDMGGGMMGKKCCPTCGKPMDEE